MSIDINLKAQEILNLLANSIHDRQAKFEHPFTFRVSEVEITRDWINELIKELGC
jgi:hypothetical protein